MRALSALLASTLAISAVFAPTVFAQGYRWYPRIATAEESPTLHLRMQSTTPTFRKSQKRSLSWRERHHLHDFDGSLLRQRQQQQRSDYFNGSSSTYDSDSYQPAAPFNNPDWYHHLAILPTGAMKIRFWTMTLAAWWSEPDNPDARQAIKDAYKAWVEDTGDGVRIDAARSLPKDSLFRIWKIIWCSFCLAKSL